MVMYSTPYVFLSLHSGGVMIYFDRIEVVNMLVPSAGTTGLDLFIYKQTGLSGTLCGKIIPGFCCSGGHCEELHC